MRTPTDASEEGRALAAAVYGHYAALARVHGSGLGGKLLLACDQGAEAGSVVRAANIAGAGTLLVTSDHALARDRVRAGVCDFLVTNLDEALRILKNEIRRKAAVAVCLHGEPKDVLASCVERGVQPDRLWASAGPEFSSADTLVSRGARLVVARAESPAFWRMASWTAAAGGFSALALVDSLALATLDAETDAERQRWLARSPQYLGRALATTHMVPLTPQEALRLAAAVRHAIHEQSLPPDVSLHYDGAPRV